MMIVDIVNNHTRIHYTTDELPLMDTALIPKEIFHLKYTIRDDLIL